MVAARGVGFVLHRVQAQRHVLLRQVLVDVEGAAAQLVGAELEAAGDEVFLLGGLAYQVDAAAGRAASGVGRARALEDLDLLDIEDFVGHAADVTNAVDHDVGAGLITSNEGAVPQWCTALAGAEGNARCGAQGVGQGGHGTILHQGFGNDGDRPGGLTQWRGEFRRAGAIALVAFTVLADHIGRLQGQCRRGAFLA